MTIDYDSVFSRMEEELLKDVGATNSVETGSKSVEAKPMLWQKYDAHAQETPKIVHEKCSCTKIDENCARLSDKEVEKLYNPNKSNIIESDSQSVELPKRISEVRISETISTETGRLINPNTIAVVESAFDIEIAHSKLDADSVRSLVDKGEALDVATDSEAKKAVGMAMQSRKMSSQIEKTRKEIVRPHLDFNAAIMLYCKEFRNKLVEMENGLLKKVEIYQGKRKKILADNNIIDASLDKIDVEDGSGKTVSQWVFDVEDISLLPVEYINVNEKAVKDAIALGVREISGIKIYEKQVMKFRVK
jgi:hypothetical protein